MTLSNGNSRQPQRPGAEPGRISLPFVAAQHESAIAALQLRVLAAWTCLWLTIAAMGFSRQQPAFGPAMTVLLLRVLAVGSRSSD